MAKYCPKCRGKYFDEAGACKKCRVDIVDYEEVPPRCPSCKKLFSFQDTICETCLVELDFFQQEPENHSDDHSADYIELVTVYETSDVTELMMIKSMFERENIHYNARGETLQNLFAIGLVGGFNPAVGTVKIDVAKKDADRASELLKEYQDRNKLPDTSDPSE